MVRLLAAVLLVSVTLVSCGGDRGEVGAESEIVARAVYGELVAVLEGRLGPTDAVSEEWWGGRCRTVTGASTGESLELTADWDPEVWSDEAGADALDRAEAYLLGRDDVDEVTRREGKWDRLFVQTELWDVNMRVDPTIDNVGITVYSACWERP